MAPNGLAVAMPSCPTRARKAIQSIFSYCGQNVSVQRSLPGSSLGSRVDYAKVAMELTKKQRTRLPCS